jgi:hypothetical protein
MPTFKELHTRWLDWLKNDPVQSISKQLYGMMWDDATFRAINEARSYTTGGAWVSQNGMLARFIDSSYVAWQSLALSKLVDRRPDVISLGRLVAELRQHRKIITRRDYLAIADLPYDYEPAAREAMERILKSSKNGVFFSHEPTSGQQARAVAQRQHKVFDRLSDCQPEQRSPSDCLSEAVVERLEGWVTSPDIKRVVHVRHKFIAHAADQKSRSALSNLPAGLTLDGIEASHRGVFRTAAAISGYILYDDGYSTPLPVPQHDQFAHWDRGMVPELKIDELHKFWDQHEEHRRDWGQGVLDELAPRAEPS